MLCMCDSRVARVSCHCQIKFLVIRGSAKREHIDGTGVTFMCWQPPRSHQGLRVMPRPPYSGGPGLATPSVTTKCGRYSGKVAKPNYVFQLI